MREHSYMTGELLSDYSELGDIINWASNHHEKMDGSGYLCISKGTPDPRRPDYLHRRYFHRADRKIALIVKGMARQEALQIMETDVVMALWIAMSFSFYATMRKRYTPSFFRPSNTPQRAPSLKRTAVVTGAGSIIKNSFICMQGNTR